MTDSPGNTLPRRHRRDRFFRKIPAGRDYDRHIESEKTGRFAGKLLIREGAEVSAKLKGLFHTSRKTYSD
jgi:hypothetical protein